jgi:Rieske Fe-S protein
MKTGMPFPAFLPQDAITAAQSANVPGVIHCDCHGSTYDPYHGASVLTGPTQRPLPFTVLEWDSSTDQLYATGSVGVPVYGHTNTLTGGTGLSGTSTTAANSVNPFP